MPLAHDVRSNLVMLVNLLNTAAGRSGPEDRMATPEDLMRFVCAHDFTGSVHASALDVAAVRALRDRFQVSLEGDLQATVGAINVTFDEIRVFPQLVSHDDWGWHLHAAADTGPLGERVAADIALVLTDLVRSGDLTRLRRCAADDCSAALADFTKNGSKRFCDVRNCANRTHVANYRTRHAS